MESAEHRQRKSSHLLICREKRYGRYPKYDGAPSEITRIARRILPHRTFLFPFFYSPYITFPSAASSFPPAPSFRLSPPPLSFAPPFLPRCPYPSLSPRHPMSAPSAPMHFVALQRDVAKMRIASRRQNCNRVWWGAERVGPCIRSPGRHI